ncbi:hypothetical protein GOV04_04680 [Candidatus Woesearchaeota archaeon]|nr:hypothetical protein [Candidatus Woesearchaeota archaeon]
MTTKKIIELLKLLEKLVLEKNKEKQAIIALAIDEFSSKNYKIIKSFLDEKKLDFGFDSFLTLHHWGDKTGYNIIALDDIKETIEKLKNVIE